MGKAIDLLKNYPKAKRDLSARLEQKSEKDRVIARKFSKDFFDGERKHGYGGFKYNPRFWQPVIPTFKEHWSLNNQSKILDVGCGKGFMMHDLSEAIPEIDVRGIDISSYAISNCIETVKDKVSVADAKELPFDDNSFDVIFSKSFIEHLYHPEKYLEEAYRVLKPNGLLLTLVPDWESQYKTYFDDFTHRTPFTKISLNDAYKMYGFNEIAVFKFRQLPIVWRYPIINYFCALISPFIPVRTQNKFFRWSRELMLVGIGKK